MKSLSHATCIKCGSDELIPGMEMKDSIQSGSDICIRFVGEPGALFDKEIIDSKFDVLVCGECGYMEFYALNPRVLKDAFRRLLSKMDNNG
jgi:predicted nucleic-acid-binding Zn-ribbon protein